MANRKDIIPKIELAQHDRSTPEPMQQSLLDIAEERGLLSTPEIREEPLVGRIGESILWSVSLAMLHFTLDVLVAHQYAVDVVWSEVIRRSFRVFPVMFFLFYSFHPHPSPSVHLPRLPRSREKVLHQLLFFASSVFAGCYLIYITNRHGYYAVMKRAPPVGSLWIWSVIELDLLWASTSLLCCILFLKVGGYAYL